MEQGVNLIPEMPPERLKLIELCQFVLNRKTENIRSELYGYLVAHALHHKKDDGLSSDEIINSLRELYGLDVPKVLVDKSLENLQSTGDIIQFQKDKFILSENMLKKISSFTEEYEGLRQQVVNQFIAKIKLIYPNLSETDSESVVRCLFSTLSSIFEKYGSLCSNIIAGRDASHQGIMALPDFQSICIHNLRELNDPILRKVVKNALEVFLKEPTPPFARLLFSLAQSYTIAQIMNLDPKLKSLETKRLSERKLYLDTNILVSLMTAQEAEFVRSVIAYSKELGVKMVYTPLTAKEYDGLLYQAKLLYRRIPIHKESIVEKVEPLMEDPFLKSFWIETISNKTLKWTGFLIRMEGMKELLSEEYGIILETPETKIDRHSPEFMQVAEACYSASQEKSNQAIVHDAFHLLLIQSLREREVVDELGFHSYFLTRDNTLTTAENMVYGEEKIFGSIHITLWFQMVSPFLSPKMCIDDVSNSYVRLLGSQFPSLTKSVNPDDLVDLMGVWMDDPSVDTEVLRKIVGSRYMKENLKKMHKIAKEDPNKISTAVGPLLETVVSNLEEKYRIKIAKIKEDNLKEITDLAEKIQSIQTSVQKSKALPKSLPIMGFLLLLSMLLSAILTTYWNMRIPEVVYWILGVGGIALIASYYFGEKVFGRFKW